ncbi:hypothetical protein ACFWMU_00175 [Streptomyces sp. NPDC058357]|uniref:hypothetical protein n=1 Tax=unclassified Streptomyces TaxID=2593676 RepID=UPI003652A89E
MFAAQTGALSLHGQQLIPGLLGRLEPGMLLVADRGITGFELWKAASETGADLLWRVRKNIVLPFLEAFEDGSYLSEIVATGDRDPDRLSFTRTLRIARRHVTDQAALPPSRLSRAQTNTAHELLERLLPPRRGRSNPRVIKHKISNWHLKHTYHRNPPQPPIRAITLVPPTKATSRRQKVA